MDFNSQSTLFGLDQDPFKQYAFDPSNKDHQDLLKAYAGGVRSNAKFCFRKCSSMSRNTKVVSFLGQSCVEHCLANRLTVQESLLKRAIE